VATTLEATMHSRITLAAACLLASLAVPGAAQAPGGAPVAQPWFERLEDSQWVRLSGAGIARRQGRVAEHGATELVIISDNQPIRLPATAVDTLWTRGRSTVAGLVVGAILGGALGALAGTEFGEENAGSAKTILSLGGIGAAGGGLLGALIGTAIPRWQRRFPSRRT
jgi:hypothetical protein